MNAIGKNTDAMVNVIATTESDTSLVPRAAASLGVSPSSMCRNTFSRTTIASSSTKPTASESARIVIMFNDKPNALIAANVPIIITGKPAMVTNVFRILRKNKSTMSEANNAP